MTGLLGGLNFFPELPFYGLNRKFDYNKYKIYFFLNFWQKITNWVSMMSSSYNWTNLIFSLSFQLNQRLNDIAYSCLQFVYFKNDLRFTVKQSKTFHFKVKVSKFRELIQKFCGQLQVFDWNVCVLEGNVRKILRFNRKKVKNPNLGTFMFFLTKSKTQFRIMLPKVVLLHILAVIWKTSSFKLLCFPFANLSNN